MVNLFNSRSIPNYMFTIILSILNRKGASVEEIVFDTSLDKIVIENELTTYLSKGQVEYKLDLNKYFLNKDLWKYWVNEGLINKNSPRSVIRSLWQDSSPVADWWPDLDRPLNSLIYYIGPYKEPYMSIYSLVLKPFIEKLGLNCSTAIDDPGSEEFLRNKILPSMKNARYVLCDLSEKNVNVHYEFGWLHALGTPFYAFTADGRASDIHHLTINGYKLTERGLEGLINQIFNSLVKNEVIGINASKPVLNYKFIIEKIQVDA